MSEQRYDVIGVQIATNKVRVMGTHKTHLAAEAYRDMAVIRRGIDEEFFAVVPAGLYDDEDVYNPSDNVEQPAPHQ